MRSSERIQEAGRRATAARPIPPMQRERFNKLKALFAAVESQITKGFTVSQALRSAAKRWRNKTYRDGRRVRFSEQRLRSLFYAWRKNGLSALGYHAKPRALSMAEDAMHDLLSRCTDRGVFSIAEAHKKLGIPDVSVHRVYRALTPAQKKLLTRYHSSKRTTYRARVAIMKVFAV